VHCKTLTNENVVFSSRRGREQGTKVTFLTFLVVIIVNLCYFNNPIYNYESQEEWVVESKIFFQGSATSFSFTSPPESDQKNEWRG
jgi:hypothetical protein